MKIKVYKPATVAGTANGRARLTEDEVRYLRAHDAAGSCLSQLAMQEFPHISASAIYKAAKGLTYKNIG